MRKPNQNLTMHYSVRIYPLKQSDLIRSMQNNKSIRVECFDDKYDFVKYSQGNKYKQEVVNMINR